jgi:hypothetical protein
VWFSSPSQLLPPESSAPGFIVSDAPGQAQRAPAHPLPIAPIRRNHSLGKPARIAPQIAPPPLATAVITALAPR